MEIDKDFTCLKHNDCLFSKKLDCEEEYQQTIPQYCDDVAKIIKCSVKNIVTSSSITNGEIKIYGKSYLNLTYLNSQNELSYADFEEDFNKTINSKITSDSSFLCVDLIEKYNNFRLINQRRVDIHIAFDLLIKVYDELSVPCIKTCKDSKLKTSKSNICNIVNRCSSKCEFDEEFEIPSDSNPIKRLVGCSGFVTLNETKVIKDKALVKGCVSLSILYTEDCDQEIISKCEHKFDISKIVDISGVCENDDVITRLTLGNTFLKSKNSAAGCLNIIEAIGDICIDLTVIRQSKVDIVTDGYAVNKKSNCTYQDYKCNKNSKMVKDKIQREISVKTSGNIQKIIDIGFNISNIILKNNECFIELIGNAVYLDDNSEIISYDFTNEISLFKDEFDDGIANANICSYDYSIVDSCSIKIRFSIEYQCMLYFVTTDKILSEIEIEENYIDYPALTIYFAKENENIWNIAKKFSSDIDMIKKENDLKTDILASNKVLIIPGI